MAAWKPRAVGTFGRALQILRVEGPGDHRDRVVLDEPALQVVEANLEASRATCLSVISVAGATRTGKSFFLDLCLKFLQSKTEPADPKDSEQESSSAANGEIKACESAKDINTEVNSGAMPAWIQTDNGQLLKNAGFKWTHGMTACTEGVWIWSEPFLREGPGGVLQAVLLMDTQGAWDSRTARAASTTLLGVVALLSSKLILNVSGQLIQPVKEHFDYIIEATSAAKKIAGIRSPDNNSSDQALHILIRDWEHFEDGATVEDCRLQMRHHLAESWGQAASNVSSTMRICGLPHPGFQVANASWSGDVADLDPRFIALFDAFIQKDIFGERPQRPPLFSDAPQAPAETFGGTLRTLLEVVEECASVLANAGSPAEAAAVASTCHARSVAVEAYRSRMAERFGPGGRDLGRATDQEVQQAHDAAQKVALDIFSRMAVVGPESLVLRQKDELKIDLRRDCQWYTAMNDEVRLDQGGQSLLMHSGIASASAGAFILGRVSALVASLGFHSGSTIATMCQGFYMPVWSFLMYEASQVALKHGLWVAAKSGLRLSVATWQQVRGVLAKRSKKRRASTGQLEVEQSERRSPKRPRLSSGSTALSAQ
eukprot:gnl/MRDRNA2_/MRDRNA2_31731_c0_seq1.p1 gnl/MRDRNA2_/MRDRNA2_31731_c0~~gnl/MRDRNA2_/MRDRNA2_31731_c0_seq1.p1  ORF type:complete len:600 (+),score=117.29 gnl/MRDRNA2_/MRDRNA2_31731_c0_seq1:75-1874(+)